MTIEEQIRTSVFNGITRSGIEALLGRPFTSSELQEYRKQKAIYDLQTQKRRRERKYEHLSSHERVRKSRDKAMSIDETMDEAYLNIDWDRRNYAKESLPNFIQTYLMDSLFETQPSPHMEQAIQEMFNALTDSRPYNIELPRGSGKTSISEAMILYLIAYGIRKFCVIVSSNARSAQNILKDIYRVVSDKDTPFVQDFPDLCLPFILCNGSTRRTQIYSGNNVSIEHNAQTIIFPRIIRNGGEVPSSGSVITTRGITSGLRGMKVGRLRPDLVLLDDIQTTESASSSEQVQKLLELIKKDVMNLCSHGKMSVLSTSTPICPEDLCEQIENDVNWKTTKFQAIISYPRDIEQNGEDGLWGRYFKLYDKESMTDQPHTESLDFYKTNREQMDEGAEIFANRYKESDGHISGLQALLERRHLIGIDAFEAEMQMKPKKLSFSLDISPRVILQRIGQYPQLVVPDGFLFVAASTDLNVSFALTTTIIAFKRDLTSVVIHHELQRCHIDQKLNDTEYNKRVYEELLALGQKLKSYGVRIDGWGIDAGGRNWEAVCEFAKNSTHLCGIPSCAMAGRASHMFNPCMRSRLRDAIGRTILCGDAKEQTKAWSGYKYMFFDSDVYRECAQRAFLTSLGAPGGCQLYNGTTDEHADFAQQVTAERIKFVKHRPDGRNEYYWTSDPTHDYLDTCAMCFAIASSQGINGETVVANMTASKGVIRRPKFKPRPRIRVR